EEDRTSLIALEFGIRDWSLSLPQGLVSGQKFALAFPVRGLHVDSVNFDDLPIPFRAIATDIETGEMVALGHGTLEHVLRASIAIPGVLSLASLDGRLLADGGLVRNLPVDVALAMGADHVIAVDVTNQLTRGDARHFASASGVLSQVVTLSMQSSVETQKALASAVIEPDLEGFRLTDFDLAAEIIRRGWTATSAMAEELRPYATGSAPSRAPQSHRRETVHVDSVAITNHSRIATGIIERSLRLRAGEDLDWDVLRADLSRIYELGLIERTDFEFIDTDSSTILHLDVLGKSASPSVVRLGFAFSEDLEHETQFRLLARLTRRAANRLGAEWRTDFAIGTDRLASSEWYQPLGPSRAAFVVPAVAYARSTRDYYDSDRDRRVAQYVTDVTSVRFETGTAVGRIGELRTGFELGHVTSTVATGPDGLPEWDTARAVWTADATWDVLDHATFPRSGGLGTCSWRGARRVAGGTLEYDRMEAALTLFASRGRTTAFWSGSAGTDFGTDAPLFEQFSLGGLRSMSGYHAGQLRGPAVATTRIGGYRSVHSLSSVFRANLYVGAWLDAGNTWSALDGMRLDELRTSASVAAGLDTPVGPVYLVYGRSKDGRDAAYLTVGLRLAGGPE
ncbi:BamA/TamA family outer membrane protein, partial [bacterium]|nr:BamA/TamA family outer membrane protein [bacterium]